MSTVTKTLMFNLQRAAEENDGLIARLRAKGRALLIDDQKMIAAYVAFLESGDHYPADEARGIWFPVQLQRLSVLEHNTVLGQRDRQDFARASHEVVQCPSWRTRGWSSSLPLGPEED